MELLIILSLLINQIICYTFWEFNVSQSRNKIQNIGYICLKVIELFCIPEEYALVP